MAKVTYLEFEKPVAQLEEKIQELRDMSSGSEGLDLTSDINGLERKKVKLLKEIFNKLSPWEMSLLARHPNRPYTLDYINMILRTSTNCTVTVLTRMILQLLAAWLVSTVSRSWSSDIKRAEIRAKEPCVISA